MQLSEQMGNGFTMMPLNSSGGSTLQLGRGEIFCVWHCSYYLLDVCYVQLESRDHLGDDTKLITVSIIAMFVLATATGWSCRPCACAYGGHVTVAYMGVVAALLAILGAFGFLSLIGSRFVNLSSVMPFLVLGISAYLLTYLISAFLI